MQRTVSALRQKQHAKQTSSCRFPGFMKLYCCIQKYLFVLGYMSLHQKVASFEHHNNIPWERLQKTFKT